MKIFIYTIIFISQLFSQINTFKADFVQTIINPSGNKIKYYGAILIKYPNKMVWQYKTPILKYVYMKDLDIVIDEPELEQAIYTKLTDEINLIDFLNNPDLVDDKYSLIFEDDKLRSINYNDDMENNITVVFDNIHINSNIPNELFNFIAPNSYDIIKRVAN